MSLIGHYADEDWPIMGAIVQIDAMAVRIDFLIDTGSSRTLLTEEDARYVGMRTSDRSQTSSMMVLGGQTEVTWQNVSLRFVTDEGRVYVYDVEVGIFRGHASGYIPSILGRDILNQWRLTLDAQTRTVEAEVRTSDFVFDH